MHHLVDLLSAPLLLLSVSLSVRLFFSLLLRLLRINLVVVVVGAAFGHMMPWAFGHEHG